MTAPAAVPVNAPLPTDPDAVMHAVLSDTKAQHTAETTDTPPRNELGQFVAASGATTATPPAQVPDAGSDAPIAGAPAPADAPAADADAVVDIPEGYVAAPALPEDKARGFTVRDTEGEIVPPDLTWELTANGKPRTLSTDKLVAYAQMGVYNHEREQATQQVQARAQQIERQYTEAQQAVQVRDQQIERLLTDPDFLYNAQQAYVQQNTPEARAQREREQWAAEREQMQVERATGETRQFLDDLMAPALELIQRTYPTVSQDELAAKFFLAADPYRRSGVLMPDGHAALKQWVVYHLEPEVRSLHEARSSERAAPKQEVADAKAKAAASVAEAQAKAQKARSVATRALRPAGKAQAETPPEPVVRSLKDAESVVLGKTMAAMRTG